MFHGKDILALKNTKVVVNTSVFSWDAPRLHQPLEAIEGRTDSGETVGEGNHGLVVGGLVSESPA